MGAKESLKAEWMYSQSKGRQFGPGEQAGLVDYLTSTCPLDPTQETEQDRKLNLILSKVQEHQSSLRRPHDPMSMSMTLPRTSSAESRKGSAPTTPRRNSSTPNPPGETAVARGGTPGHASTPTSALSTPTHTPGLHRRHSTGRGTRVARSRSSPTPNKRTAVIPPAHYKMELPPTLYGDDLVNGNTEMMTQSMDPSVLAARLDNGQVEEVMSVSSVDLMSQSVDSNLLRDNLNERGHHTPSHTARPRTLFYSNRSVRWPPAKDWIGLDWWASTPGACTRVCCRAAHLHLLHAPPPATSPYIQHTTCHQQKDGTLAVLWRTANEMARYAGAVIYGPFYTPLGLICYPGSNG